MESFAIISDLTVTDYSLQFPKLGFQENCVLIMIPTVLRTKVTGIEDLPCVLKTKDLCIKDNN